VISNCDLAAPGIEGQKVGSEETSTEANLQTLLTDEPEFRIEQLISIVIL